MKFPAALLALALAGSAVAQFSGLPTCATNCADKYLAGGIGNCGTNAKCICSQQDFIASISCCVAAACDAADQALAVTFAQQICNANGVTVPNGVTCSSTLTSAGAATTPGAGAATTPTPTSTPSTGGGSAATGSSSTGNFAPRETAGLSIGAVGGLIAALAML